MSKQGRYCILCYVEEDVSICRKCLVPWRAAYDSNNAFSKELRFARAEDEPHMLCLHCVSEDMANEKELTLPVDALDDTARLQLKKIRKVEAECGHPPLFELIAMETLNLKPAKFANVVAKFRPPPLNDQGADRQPAVQKKVLTSKKVQNQKMVLKKVANEGADQQEGAEGGALSAVPSGPDRKKVLTSRKVQNQKLVLKKVANEGADQQEGAEGGAVSAVPSGPDRKKVLTSKKVQNPKLVLKKVAGPTGRAEAVSICAQL
jgi:hypothetical protein